jgi:hypothetical protein
MSEKEELSQKIIDNKTALQYQYNDFNSRIENLENISLSYFTLTGNGSSVLIPQQAGANIIID